MNRNEYLAKLNNALSGLPYKVRQDMLNDYQEHFRSGLEMGRTEEEISDSLGDPDLIAEELRGNPRYNRSSRQRSSGFFRSVYMSILLTFMNLIFVLAPYLTLAMTIAMLWLTSFALCLSGLACIGMMLFSLVSPAHRVLMELGFSFFTITSGSVLISSIGIMLGIGCWYTSKAFIRLTVKYASWNYYAIIGRRY